MGLFKTALLQSRVPDYPNDDWTTVADVPTGARVLDGGVLKQARKKSCTFIDQSTLPHYYCDSVNGLDSNDGLTELTPKQTVAAVEALASGPCVFEFARGSYFREQHTHPFNGCVTKDYGTGDRPIFDCADVVDTFTKTGGFTNVYQFTYANELTISGKCKTSMWFDNIRMIRATSQANCDATAGSYYVVQSYSGSDTVYFHSPDSLDPNSDGRVYEVSVRLYGIETVGYTDQTGTGEVYNMHTQRNGGNNGSLLGSKYISGCYAYDGTVHNIWNGGIAEYCVAERFEPTAIGNATLFVSFISDADSSTSYRYTNCVGRNITAEQYGWKQISAPAFYCHTDDNNPKIKHILYENCTAENVGTFGGGIAETIAEFNCNALNTYEGYNGECDKMVMINCRSSWQSENGDDNWAHRRSLTLSNATNAILKGIEFAHRNISGGMIYTLSSAVGNYEIAYSTFYTNGSTFSTAEIIDKVRTTASTINYHHNIAKVSPSKFFDDPGNATLQGDYNLFNVTGECKGRLNAVAFNTIAELQALNGSNLNTIAGDPLFTGDPATGDFSIDPSSPANTIGAGSTNYVVTDQDLRYMNVLEPV